MIHSKVIDMFIYIFEKITPSIKAHEHPHNYAESVDVSDSEITKV